MTATYTPNDGAITNCSFDFHASPCNCSIQAIAKQSSLELTHPNGGEEFVVGIDTVANWLGLLESDTIKISLTRDNGDTWVEISDTALGFSQDWLNIGPPASNQCLMKISNNVSPNSIEWEKCLGGSDAEVASTIIQTLDGGYIVAGFTTSNDGDITDPHSSFPYNDYWVVKLNVVGAIEWERCIGGSSYESANSIVQTLDGGYIVAGFTSSRDGDVSDYQGAINYWIVKLSSTGVIKWEKCFGRGGEERAYSIGQTIDGGYIIAGEAGPHSGLYWIVKIDSIGSVEWEKPLAGGSVEKARSIVQTLDGGYIVAGESRITTVNEGEHHGDFDFRIVKLNAVGNIEWEKFHGGSGRDKGYSIVQTLDSGYIAAGWTTSTDGDVTGHHGGYSDYWIVKLNAVGNIEWEKCLGGTENDEAYSIVQTLDGEYIVAGCSKSNDGDVTGNRHGNYDYWIVKLDSSGIIKWQKCLGGDGDDTANSITQTYDGGYIVAGMTQSSNGDVTGNHGTADFWVVKLSPEYVQEDISDSTFSIVLAEVTAKNIEMGGVLIDDTKDSIVTDFIINIKKYPCRIDAIYFEGNDSDAFKLVGGIPKFTVVGDSIHQGTFRFQPTEVRDYQATIKIITQADTMEQTIRGKGIDRGLEIVNQWINFGEVPVGGYKDNIEITIKNISTQAIEILNTKHEYPDSIHFSTNPGYGGKFTLQPGEEYPISLRFSPTAGERTQGSLSFYYDGVGSPAISTIKAV